MTNALVPLSQVIGACNGAPVVLNEPYRRLFENLIKRAGGANAPSNTDLDKALTALKEAFDTAVEQITALSKQSESTDQTPPVYQLLARIATLETELHILRMCTK